MKRQSIAEQTLNKQIAVLTQDINDYKDKATKIWERVTALENVRDHLKNEVDYLKAQRIRLPEKSAP